MLYKTRFSTWVRKGMIGECVKSKEIDRLELVLIKFKNGEKFWYLKRDLVEVTE